MVNKKIEKQIRDLEVKKKEVEENKEHAKNFPKKHKERLDDLDKQIKPLNRKKKINNLKRRLLIFRRET